MAQIQSSSPPMGHSLDDAEQLPFYRELSGPYHCIRVTYSDECANEIASGLHREGAMVEGRLATRVYGCGPDDAFVFKDEFEKDPARLEILVDDSFFRHDLLLTLGLAGLSFSTTSPTWPQFVDRLSAAHRLAGTTLHYSLGFTVAAVLGVVPESFMAHPEIKNRLPSSLKHPHRQEWAVAKSILSEVFRSDGMSPSEVSHSKKKQLREILAKVIWEVLAHSPSIVATSSTFLQACMYRHVLPRTSIVHETERISVSDARALEARYPTCKSWQHLGTHSSKLPQTADGPASNRDAMVSWGLEMAMSYMTTPRNQTIVNDMS